MIHVVVCKNHDIEFQRNKKKGIIIKPRKRNQMKNPNLCESRVKLFSEHAKSD